MALAQKDRFEPHIEHQMKDFYNSLSEKARRRYAGVEAMKLPYGGIQYIAQVLDCNEKTVTKGMEEVAQLADGDPLAGRDRQEGAGRPKKK